jgi:hypothetical protein
MAEVLVRRPTITSPFVQDKQKSTASNRLFAGNCVLAVSVASILSAVNQSLLRLSELALTLGS